MQKPSTIVGRDHHWRVLERFLSEDTDGTQLRLGIVSGRRRIGKTQLLIAACEATDGFYFMCGRDEGDLATRTRFAQALNEYAGTSDVLAAQDPPDWIDLLRTVLTITARAAPSGTSPLIVIDEYPYALTKAPQLSGMIQLLYDEAQFRNGPGGHVILCGSALSVMNNLLAGDKPLRGRARVDMRLQPLDFRETARLWNTGDPEVARLVHAVVGGIPGYHTLIRSAPESPRDFGDWLVDNLLTPGFSSFTQFEMDYLLREDPHIKDLAIYNDVLSAVANGASTVAKVAARVGRSTDTVRYPIGILESAGYLTRTKDLLGRRKPSIITTDPIIKLDRLITAPNRSQIERGLSRQVWDSSSRTFATQILGPHFEELAREWVLRFAPEELNRSTGFGDVGNAHVHDNSGRAKHEIDVLALHDERITFLGEAKATVVERGMAELERLDGLANLLDRLGYDTSDVTLGIFSLNGFRPDLKRAAANRTNVELVDMDRLYGLGSPRRTGPST